MALTTQVLPKLHYTEVTVYLHVCDSRGARVYSKVPSHDDIVYKGYTLKEAATARLATASQGTKLDWHTRTIMHCSLQGQISVGPQSARDGDTAVSSFSARVWVLVLGSCLNRTIPHYLIWTATRSDTLQHSPDHHL